MGNSKVGSKNGYARSLEEIEMILDNLPGLVFYKDDKNNIVRVNKYFADAQKTTKENLAGKNCFDLYPKDVAQAYFDDDLEVIKSKKPKLNIIEPWELEEGRRWINTSKIPLFDENNKCIGVLGFATDVTAQVEAEQKLKQAHEQLNTIFSNLKDIVFVISEDYKILFKNDSAHDLFGTDLIGKDCYDVIKGQDQPCERCALKILGESDLCQVHFEKTINTPFLEEERFFDIISSPIESYAGQPAIVEVLRDITARKKVEEINFKLATIVENSDDAIIGKTLDGTINSWNKGAERIYSYTSKEIIGKPISILVPSDRFSEVSDILERIKAGDRIDHFETVRVRKDGEEINISMTISPIKDTAGNIIGASTIARNITERKKMEEELSATNQVFNAILSNVSICAIRIDEDGTYTQALGSGFKKWGFIGSELVGVNALEKFPQVRDKIKRVLSGERVEFIDGGIINGKPVYFQNYLFPDTHTGNGLIGINIDITDIKVAEQRLKESEEWLSTTFKSIGDAVITTDTQGNVSLLNPVAEALTGWKHNEAIGKPIEKIFNIINEETLKTVESPISKVLREGIIVGLANHTLLISKDGKEIPIDDSGAPIKGTKGDTIGVVLVFRDITERKKAEEKEQNKTKIINAINKIFQNELTCESVEDLGKICLEVAQELSGAKFGFFGEVNKEGKFDTIAISNPGWDECKMPDSEATKIIKGMEIRGMQFLPLKEGKSRILNDPSNHPDSGGTPKGHPKITCFLAVPFKYKGKIIGQIGLGNKPGGFDHHDQEAIETLSVAMIEALMIKRVEENIKKSEENLRVSNKSLKKALEELKRSNKELEQFAYVASHDLQEPLRMVASFTQLLQNRYQDKLDEDANDFINYAVDGAIRMQNLISDLLIFSRVGTRGKPFKTTDMNVVLEAVINMFRQIIKKTDTKITYNPLPVILADESQIIQLMQNLISNAIKFSSEEPPRIHVSGEVKADKWIFSVSDNGIGMDSKYFDRIFIIFQRLHKKSEYGGTGIGLAVCKKIIQRHGGKIWVESKLGKGSTFYFTIPKKNGLDNMKIKNRVGIAQKIDSHLLKD